MSDEFNTSMSENESYEQVIHEQNKKSMGSKRRAIEDILEDRYLSYEADPYDRNL
jgi:hypothetical protein